MQESRLDLHGDPLPPGASGRGRSDFTMKAASVLWHFRPMAKALRLSPMKKGNVAALLKTTTGKELTRIQIEDYADGLTFTPDGKGLLVYRCTPTMHDCVSGKLLRSFQGAGHAFAYHLPTVGCWPLSTSGPIT